MLYFCEIVLHLNGDVLFMNYLIECLMNHGPIHWSLCVCHVIYVVHKSVTSNISVLTEVLSSIHNYSSNNKKGNLILRFGNLSHKRVKNYWIITKEKKSTNSYAVMYLNLFSVALKKGLWIWSFKNVSSIIPIWCH